MDRRKMLSTIMLKLQNKGAQKVTLDLNIHTEEEFNLVYKELNLLRSVERQYLSIHVLKDDKSATGSLNQFDDASVDKVVEEIMQAVELASPDPAFDIAPYQESMHFEDGVLGMDAELIIRRLDEFAQEMKRDFACVGYDASVSHVLDEGLYMNSNGVEYSHRKGSYNFVTMFTAKKDGKMSSFNYVGYDTLLDKPLMDINETREYMQQIMEQTVTKGIPQNFVGEVIMGPLVMESLVYSLITQQFGDGAIITKSSRFPDHVEQKLFDEKFTICNKPSDQRLISRSFITDDGFRTVDAPVIEKGVLKHYPIGLYACNKSGKTRTIGRAENYIIEPGDTPLKEMISKVKQGILCMRASYGSPSSMGDMSSVVKNSYYIEDGKIQYPISETMMSFNLIDAFNNIKDISAEVYNTGGSIMPYISIGGVHISAK